MLVFFESPLLQVVYDAVALAALEESQFGIPPRSPFTKVPQKETFSLYACVETPVGHLFQDPHPRRRCTREGAVLAIGTYAGDTIVVLYHSWSALRLSV